MSAGIYNFTIEQDSTFSRTLTWKDENGDPIDLTGATAELIARVRETDTTPAISLTDASGLTLGGVAGTITIDLTDVQTAALDFSSANYKLKVNNQIIMRGVVSLVKDETE